MPTPEEIQSYIRTVAAKYGIDAETFLRVVKGESGFNPAAVGDSGHSKGIAQLYDKGLAPQFTQQTGMDAGDPNSWKAQLDFMGKQVAQGGQGWAPWHAAGNQGISQFAGLGGQPGTAMGQQGLAGTASMPPTTMAAGTMAPAGKGGMSDLEMLRKMFEPQKTLASGLVDALMPERAKLPYDQKSHTLGGLALNGLGSFFKSPNEMAQEKALGDKPVNPASPIALKTQLTQAQKPTLGTTFANYAFGTKPPVQTASLLPQKKTIGSGLFSLFGF